MINKNLIFFLKYDLKCWLYLPITFIRRILLGKDRLCKRYFWDKWGLSKEILSVKLNKKTIWIVANSGGEILQSLSLLKRIKNFFPDYYLVLSTESYDTFRYAKEIEEVNFVFFSPWDISIVCKRVLKLVNPRILIFVEHCYFPVLCKAAKKLQVKTAVCSGLINSFIFKGNFSIERSFCLKFYEFIDAFAVKSRADPKNLKALGIMSEKIFVLGDLRLDLEYFLLNNFKKEKLKNLLKLTELDQVFVVGSIHKGEVDLVLNAFKELQKTHANLKLILAPRWSYDIPFVEKKLSELAVAFIRRTKVSYLNDNRYEVLILDTFGELPYFYGIASVAFVASTIVPINNRKLGHNIFEPLAWGVPVLFGPHINLWKNFAERLKEIWPGCEVNDSEGLARGISQILSDAALRKDLKCGSLNMAEENRGIAQKYLEFIRNNLPS